MDTDEKLNRAEHFGDFYEFYRNEKISHGKTKIWRTVFLMWAVVATMMCVFLIWYMAGFTYVEPEKITTTVTQDTGEGGNAIYTAGANSGVNVYGETDS